MLTTEVPAKDVINSLFKLKRAYFLLLAVVQAATTLGSCILGLGKRLACETAQEQDESTGGASLGRIWVVAGTALRTIPRFLLF